LELTLSHILNIYCALIIKLAEDEDANTISRMEKNKASPKRKGLNPNTDYTKYAVGGESKEVPAPTGLEENRNLKERREQSKNNNLV
jgi:hypothetical protein